MEYLNRVELTGVVGTVSRQVVGDAEIVRFSLATEVSYKSNDGSSVVETTWHNVSAWGSPKCQIDKIEKGAWVHVVGRLRQLQYTDWTGEPKRYTEIMAGEINVLEGQK